MKSTFALIGSITLAVLAYSESYIYDDVGRLAQVTYDDGSGIIYTYDNNSNLLGSVIFMTEGVTITIRSGEVVGNVTRYEIDFDALIGATYRFEAKSNLDSESWEPYAYSLSPSGSETTEIVSNVIGETTLYFSIENSSHPKFFRLARLTE